MPAISKRKRIQKKGCQKLHRVRKPLTVQLKPEKALGCGTDDRAWIQDSGSQRTSGFWSKNQKTCLCSLLSSYRESIW